MNQSAACPQTQAAKKTIKQELYAMNQTKFISRRTLLTGVSAAAIAAASPALFAAPKPKAKALIILFSRSGNTAYLAEQIHAETGAPILRIEPKVPYAPRYSDMTDGAREEIRKWSRREIKTKIPDLSGYDTIFICAPLWWGHLDTPMRTFLMDHPLAGKTVFPVTTSGSSSPAGVVADIHKLCPKATIKPEFWVPGDEARKSDAELKAWLKKSGF